MTPLEFYLSNEVPEGEFILGIKSDGREVKGCSREEIHVIMQGKNESNADGLFVIGMYKHILDDYYQKGFPEPTVMYIVNERQGRSFGMREVDE